MRARIILTLKQHRFEVIAVTVVCLGLAALAAFEAWRLFALNTPAACLANPYGFITGTPVGPTSTVPAVDPCQIPLERRNAFLNSLDMNLVRTLLVFAPFVSGIALGAPLVAREIEQGTAPLSWALAGSRWRWLLPRIAAITLLIVPVLLAIGLASDYLESALIPGTDPHSSFDTYLLRGVILVFWGLAAFFGTVALGTIFGRTLPAVFLALVICGFVRVAWDYEINRVVLAPASQALLDTTKAPGLLDGDTRNPWQTNLVFSYRNYLDGKPISEDEVSAWWMAHQPKLDANGNPVGGFVPPDPSQSPYQIPFGIPGSQYWPVIALESGILLAGAFFCGGVALVWVERRRPY
jgi:hypothetical protein